MWVFRIDGGIVESLTTNGEGSPIAANNLGRGNLVLILAFG
jgi:hypothetical protein